MDYILKKKEKIMKKCGWCDEDTLQIYTLKDGKSLCIKCAEKHYDIVNKKMTNHIQEIHNSLKDRAESLHKLKRQMCKHENIYDTGYCRWSDKLRHIYKCNDCGKEILKDYF